MSASAEPLICIDARMLSPVPHGFSRYVSRMIAGLARVRDLAHGDVPYRLKFLVNASTPREALLQPGGESPAPADALELRSPFLGPLEMLEIPGALSRAGVALYHSPTFSSVLGLPCPSIVTIHDLNHLAYGSFKQRFYYDQVLRRFARRSRAVLTVSEFSKGELARWLSLPPDAIEVVPNALDPKLAVPLSDDVIDAVLEHRGLERGRYFLCLSNAKPHKNIAMLVEAYKRLVAEAPLDARSAFHWPLVLSMPAPDGAPPGVRGVGGLGDEEVVALLQAAGAVCFPSLYEGFGLPPVEAICAGAALLVSDIPPHREGLQDLTDGECVWLPPADVGAWSKALATAQQGRLAPASRASRSRVLHRYSVDRLGQSMDRIYRGVLGLS